MLSFPVKDPDDHLDYSLSWALRLPGSDSIVNSTWFTDSVSSPGLVIDSNEFDANSTTAWISGGMIGTTYIVTNRVTTAQDRIMDYSVKLKVKAR